MSEEKSVVAVPPPPDLGIVVPPKRKKGRPPKNRALIPAGDDGAAPRRTPDGRGRKPKRKIGDVVWPAVDSAFVGQQVHGVLDGSFDAGYLLTVRVGNTETVLRGAVFEPTLSVPISQSNDIAPNVSFIRRDEKVAPMQHLVEKASVDLPSSAVVPPVSASTIESAPTPMEEDKRHPPEAPTAGASLLPLMGNRKEDYKETASPSHSSHFEAEQKMDLQSGAPLQAV